jgi:hypothetical protein
MHDAVDSLQCAVDQLPVANVTVKKLDFGRYSAATFEGNRIGGGLGGSQVAMHLGEQSVQHADEVPPFEQLSAQEPTDEPGSAGHEDPHGTSTRVYGV